MFKYGINSDFNPEFVSCYVVVLTVNINIRNQWLRRKILEFLAKHRLLRRYTGTRREFIKI